MPLPPEADELIARLTGLYDAAQREVLDELERLATMADPTGRVAIRRARVNELGRALNAELTQLDRHAQRWLAGEFPEVYALGAGQGGLDFQWTAASREAVAFLADDLHDDLLTATRFVRRDAKVFIRQAAQLSTRATILQGQTAVQGGKVLAARLADRGIAAITYRNGARHSLGEYAGMAVRTKSAQAYNAGAFTNSRDHGVEWMECYDGPACGLTSHNDSDLANGTIRPIEEAEAWPIAHPNCARSWGPRPDVRSPRDAETARRYSPEEQQQMARAERARVAKATTSKRPPRARPPRRERTVTRREGVKARHGKAAAPAAPPPIVATGVDPATAIESMPGPRSAVGSGVRHSLEQIRSVHRIPGGLPAIPVKPSTARGYYGQYSYRMSGTPSAIRIQTAGDHIAGTFAHEFGHYLDHQANLVGQVERMAASNPGLRVSAAWGSGTSGAADPLMHGVLDAIQSTPTWERLAEFAKAPGARANGASYYASSKEAWARAYHQWIATRTADPTMLAELDAIVAVRVNPKAVRGWSQWPADEFGPIADAFEAVFRAKGLLVE